MADLGGHEEGNAMATKAEEPMEGRVELNDIVVNEIVPGSGEEEMNETRRSSKSKKEEHIAEMVGEEALDSLLRKTVVWEESSSSSSDSEEQDALTKSLNDTKEASQSSIYHEELEQYREMANLALAGQRAKFKNRDAKSVFVQKQTGSDEKEKKIASDRDRDDFEKKNNCEESDINIEMDQISEEGASPLPNKMGKRQHSKSVPVQETSSIEYDLPDRPSNNAAEGMSFGDSEGSLASSTASIFEGRTPMSKWLKQVIVLFVIGLLWFTPGLMLRLFAQGFYVYTVPAFTWCLTIAFFFWLYIVAMFFVFVITAIVEYFFLENANVIYYLVGVKRPFRWLLWSIFATFNWRYTMTYSYELDDEPFDAVDDDHLSWVIKIFECLCVTFAFLLIKALIVKRMANAFHKKAYFERIQNSLFAENALRVLCTKETFSRSRAGSVFQKVKEGFARVNSLSNTAQGGKFENEIEQVDFEEELEIDLDKDNNEEHGEESLQATLQPTDKQMHEVMKKYGRSAVPHIPFLAGPNVTGSDFEYEGGTNSPQHAKKVAKLLFKKLKKPGTRVIHYADFEPYFSDLEKRARAFALFDTTGDGLIEKKEMIQSVKDIFRERKALAYSLSDSETIVETLDIVLTTITFIILFFIYLIIFGVDLLSFLVAFAGILAAFTFAFGEMIKDLLSNVIFLFVVNPFSVGDRITLPEGNSYVASINLQYTEFDRWDGQKIYYRNTILQQVPILNVMRSGHMYNTLLFDIDRRTSVKKIRAIQAGIHVYLTNNATDWYPEFDFVLDKITDNTKLTFMLWIQQRRNFQSATQKFIYRTNFFLFLKELLEELEIEYYPPLQRIAIEKSPYCDDPTPSLHVDHDPSKPMKNVLPESHDSGPERRSVKIKE
eukprot:Nk52_evm68s221 gene=Nk52_evmTU68s221